MEEILSNEEIRSALKRIIEYEEKQMEIFRTDPIYKGLQNPQPWWELMDIPVEWHIVRKLILAGIVKKIAKKTYRLVDREQVKKMLEEYEKCQKIQEEEVITEKTINIPQDLFDVIEGYDDIKEFILMSLRADEPVHCLLIGAPGTAKSLFLMELERLDGSRFVTAGTATKVGIRDIIFEELPRILLIDEIDKISDPKDLSCLLTWMESGRIIIAKHGKREERRGKGWVFAAGNRIDKLPPELIDRFQVFHIKPYTREQFKRIVTNYLVKRKNIDHELASYIAEKVGEYTVSVREAIRIAKLAKSKEQVDKIIEIIRRYRP